MRRLYTLVNDNSAARDMRRELTTLGLDREYIHTISSLPSHRSPATFEQTSDVRNSQIRGVLTGAVTGFCGGFVVASTIGVLGAAIVPMSLGTVLGAALGLSFGTIVGASEPHPIMKKFERELDQGRVLVAADVPDEFNDSVVSLLRHRATDGAVRERTLTGVEKVA